VEQNKQSIISTLAYYHALRVPSLTFPEIFYYLTPLGHSTTGEALDGVTYTPSFYMVKRALEDLEKQETLISSEGYYALAKLGSPQKRVEDMQNQQEKGAIFSRVARLLPYIPYVRMVGLAGSVAINSARHESDIDVLIAGARGRIWTTRILVTLVAHLTGKRRYGPRVANRICLNHYVTENTPSGPHIIPLAHTYAQMLLYWQDMQNNDPLANNPWIHHMLPNAHGMRSYVHAQQANIFGLASKKVAEIILDHTVGPVLEYVAKKYQTRRIQKSLGDTRPDPLELTISDQELRFHYPFSRSKDALKRYQETLKQCM